MDDRSSTLKRFEGMSREISQSVEIGCRSLSDAFNLRFAEELQKFQKRRAHVVAQRLVENRRGLDALIEGLGDVLCSQIEGDAVVVESETKPTISKRTARKRKQTIVSGKLERGTVVSIKINKKASVHPRFREAYSLPRGPSIPTYTSWTFVPHNQIQSKVRIQKRLFYTDDDTGETLPASDDDECRSVSYFTWDGHDLEWREHCLSVLRKEFGSSPLFSELLATQLNVDVVMVRERIRRNEHPKVKDTTVLLCRRCLQYNCSLHPESTVLPAYQTPPSREVFGTPCSEACWRMKPQNENNEIRNNLPSENNVSVPVSSPELQNFENRTPWTEIECSLLEKVFDIYGDNPCSLRRFVQTRTCREIHQYLLDHPWIQTKRFVQPLRRRKPTKKAITSRKGAPVIPKRMQHRESELWHQYLPCNCKGSCTAACPCIKSKNFCDKYCACWNGHKSMRKICSNAWKGCKCQQKCDTLRCPCVAASRECDPDLCTGCKTDGAGLCKNMNVRTRRHKRVAMGLSEIIGWGTFMLDEVKKDDLIGEYTGELISDEEAERRGRIYDIEDKSYLFSATSETVIDANHRGNKLRFANHSSEPNCYVKYLLVDGDYRVGIFAGRDIHAGEELLYDYGSSFLSNWNDERQGNSHGDHSP